MKPAEDNGRVVVTAAGGDAGSPVDPRFGRAAWLLLVDVASGRVEKVVDNQAGVGAAQGAGIQAAETVARLGARAVITGHCGPKAHRALSAAGITIVTGAGGTVAEAVASFREGALECAGAPDVGGHWA